MNQGETYVRFPWDLLELTNISYSYCRTVDPTWKNQVEVIRDNSKEDEITRLMTTTKKLVVLLWREVAKFGVVGGLGWVIDNGIYIILHTSLMNGSTLKARVVSSSIAILFSWFANRYWTFRHRRGDRVWREFLVFIFVSLIGMAIAILCQYVSHYILGFKNLDADLISGGVVGLILGTIFRFLAYRFFVFKKELDEDDEFNDDGVPKTLNYKIKERKSA